MEEFLKTLKIRPDGEITEDKYTDSFHSSAKFAKISNLLNDADDLDLLDSESFLDVDNAKFVYESDLFSVALSGDFNEDSYNLTIIRI